MNGKGNLLENRLKEIPKDIEEFVSLSFDISDRIRDVLEENNISQKRLAQLLGKRESEVSKWLKGTHNFTIETIAKISVVLDTKIFYIPTKTKSLVEIKQAISDFECLYNKSSNERFFNIKLQTLPEKSIYKNEDHIGHVGSEKKIAIKKVDSTTIYKLACTTNFESSKESPTISIVF